MKTFRLFHWVTILSLILSAFGVPVAAQAQIQTPEFIFYDGFQDGELAHNPTWTYSDTAWYIQNGQLNHDGVIADSSDRYRTAFVSNFPGSSQTSDYLELSYYGLLKSNGNPQEGRGIELHLIGKENLEDQNDQAYQLRLQKSVTSGGSVNYFSFALSYDTPNGWVDLLVSNFEPEYDQGYVIKAIRQNGIWTLYVDSQVIGSAIDPLGMHYLKSYFFDVVGSLVIDDVLLRTAPASSPWTIYTTANSGLPNNNVTSVAFDQNGKLWFLANSYDGNTWISNPNINEQHRVTVDHSNNVWVGTYGSGLWKYDGTNWTAYRSGQSALIYDIVRAFAYDVDGSMWLSTGDAFGGNAVYRYDGSNWQTILPSSFGLPDRTVLSMAVDQQSVKWFGTWGAGVVRYDGSNWSYLTSSNSPLPFNEVWSLAAHPDGSMWFGTGLGVAHYDGTHWTTYNPSGDPERAGIFAMTVDRNGDVWAGGSGGLFHYDGNAWTVYNSSNSPLPNDWVDSVATDPQGRILVGTHGGAALLDPQGGPWPIPSPIVTPTPTFTPTPTRTSTPTMTASPYVPRDGHIYDAFDDFSAISNPPPESPWIYGYTWGLGSAFDDYRKLTHDIDRELSIMWTRPENFITPDVNKNISGQDIINVDGCILHPAATYLHMHPGQNNEYSVVRFIAPSDGMYQIDSAFKSLRFCSQVTTTDAHVLYNSSSIYDVMINEYISAGEHPFSTTMTLQPGDTIDFVVGVGSNGNYGADSTGLRATITRIIPATGTPTNTFTETPTPNPTLTPTQTLTPTLPPPLDTNIIARLTLNQVDADGWPAGASLTITIDDPATGVSPDYTDSGLSQLVDPQDPTAGTAFTFFFHENYTLKSGDVVTVAGEGSTRTTTVADIHVTDVDPELDIVSGTAGPGITSVNVRLWSSPIEMQRDAEVTDGIWSANFSVASPDFGVYDLKPGDNGVVRWFEGDGDFTTDYWNILNPTIGARANEDQIQGDDWPLGDTVTIKVDDPQTPSPIDYATFTRVGMADWDPNQTWFQIHAGGYDLKAGDHVTVTNGKYIKNLVVSGYRITNVDLDSDKVYGGADPGQVVNIWTCWQNDPCINREETTGQDGNWVTDFSVPGNLDWEQTTADLRPGSWVDSSVNDDDGDGTFFGWSVPNPTIAVRVNEHTVEGNQWPLGSTVQLTFDDLSTAENPDYQTSVVVGQANWDPTQTYFWVELQNMNPKAGDIVTATDGQITKQHIIQNLELTSMNLDTDVVQGKANPGQQVNIVHCWNNLPCVNREETTGSDGTWSANFSVPGDKSWETIDDLRTGSWVDSSISDEDGDTTTFGMNANNTRFQVQAYVDRITLVDWPFNLPITVTVDNPTTAQSPDHEETILQDGSSNWFEFTVNYDVKPGDLVRISNDTVTKETVVADVEATTVDAQTGYVEGIAPPNSIIYMDITGDAFVQSISRTVYTDSTGHWSVDLAEATGTLPWKWLTRASMTFMDYDNDWTLSQWHVHWPVLEVWLNESELRSYDWEPGTLLTFSVDDPATDAPVDFSDQAVATPLDWINHGGATLALGGRFTLQPGMTVSVTDGITTKSTVIRPIAFTSLNALNDTVTGTAPSGASLDLTLVQGNSFMRFLTADAQGQWLVDYRTPDRAGNTNDLVAGDNFHGLFLRDDDIDATVRSGTVPNYTLHAVPAHPEIHGHDWLPGSNVTVTVDEDTNPDNGVLYTQTRNMDDDPWCGSPCFDLQGVFDLQEGQYVTMADGWISRTVQISSLRITEVDTVNDRISGVAEPGSRVAVNIWSQDGLARYETAQADGTWVADFSVVGDEDVEQFTTDITYGDNGRAIQLNPDGTDDGTLEYWNVDWVAPPSVPAVFALSSNVDINIPVATVENISVLNVLNDGLFWLDKDNNLQPLAATGYVQNDNVTYTVNLRPGAVWSDGQPVTAQQYVDGILRILDPNGGSDYGFILFPILNAREFNDGSITDPSLVGVKAVDSRTLVFTLKESTAHFPYILASPVILPARLDVIQTYGTAWTQPSHYVSNGPYRLVEYDAAHILVEKDPLYNGSMQGGFSQIGFDVIPDPAEQIAAYKNGTVDVLLGTPLQQIMNDPDLVRDLSVLPSPGVQYIGLSNQVFPTNNPLVRKALAAAINRESLIRNVLKTPWRVEASGVISPELPGYQGSEVGYSYDPAQARQFLAEAGYPNGVGFPVLKVIAVDSNRAILEEIVQQWQTVLGITVQVDYVPGMDRMRILSECRATPADCQYQGYLLGWSIDYPDAYNLLNDLFSPASPYNYTQWNSPAYLQFLEQAVSEENSAQRVLYLQDAQNVLVTEETAVIPLFHLDGAMVIRPGIYPYYSPAYFTNLAYWNDVDPAGDGMTAGVVGSSGGMVASESNTVTVQVPANALQQDVALSVTDLGGNYQIADSQTQYSVLNRYSIQPHGLQFNQPVTLTFHWNDENNDGLVDNTSQSEAGIRLFKDGEVKTPPCSENPDCSMGNNTLIYQVTSLSRFELVLPVDSSTPLITPTINGIKGNNDWYVGNVVINWEVSDPESGISSTDGCDSATLNIDTATLTLTCMAANGVGLTNSKSVTVKIDKTTPVITWAGSIQNDDTFSFGVVPPAPTCTATDSLSGVDGFCAIIGYATTIGNHTLVATARDKAGNQTSESRTYTVSGWTLKGFYQPVDMNGVYNLVKGGSTVPFKFEIFAGPTELTNVADVKSLTYAETSCTANAITDEIELTVTGDTGLRYDPSSGQFIYNWKTPKNAGKCYRLTLITLEGSSIGAYFKLK